MTEDTVLPRKNNIDDPETSMDAGTNVTNALSSVGFITHFRDQTFYLDQSQPFRHLRGT